jgi:hypothetical protein
MLSLQILIEEEWALMDIDKYVRQGGAVWVGIARNEWSGVCCVRQKQRPGLG